MIIEKDTFIVEAELECYIKLNNCIWFFFDHNVRFLGLKIKEIPK